MKFIGIIPARYASTRFPGKPLVKLGGKFMIERVYEQVAAVLDDTCVATDDQRIFDAVKAFGGNVVMTSPDHKSGTDRIEEAVTKIEGCYDVVVNIRAVHPALADRNRMPLLRRPFHSDSHTGQALRQRHREHRQPQLPQDSGRQQRLCHVLQPQRHPLHSRP